MYYNKPKIGTYRQEQTVDPDQMPLNAASDQDPHCLQTIQQILNALTSNIVDLLKY